LEKKLKTEKVQRKVEILESLKVKIAKEGLR
jgi:hypothetical protein